MLNSEDQTNLTFISVDFFWILSLSNYPKHTVLRCQQFCHQDVLTISDRSSGQVSQTGCFHYSECSVLVPKQIPFPSHSYDDKIITEKNGVSSVELMPDSFTSHHIPVADDTAIIHFINNPWCRLCKYITLQLGKRKHFLFVLRKITRLLPLLKSKVGVCFVLFCF